MSSHKPVTISANFNWLFSSGWIIVILLLLLDSFGGKQTTTMLLGVSSVNLALIYLVVLTLGRALAKVKLTPRLIKFTAWVVVPASLGIGLTLGLLEPFTSPNYIYSLTRLNPDILVTLGHFSLAVVVLAQTSSWFHRQGRVLAWLAPVWLIFINLWTQLLPFDAAVAFTKEDGPVETIQNLLILTTILLAVAESWQAKISKHYYRFWVFLLIAGAFFFIGMEEISWGQRIFGITTPDLLTQVNVQDETNIHNIGILNELQLVVYIAISGAIVAAPVLTLLKIVGQKIWFPPILASWYMILPLLTFVYFAATNIYFIHPEVIEVLFYAGLLWWVLDHQTQLT